MPAESVTVDKKSLSERDICTKFITPAVRKAGWDQMTQIREEVHFTKGRILVASWSAGARANGPTTFSTTSPTCPSL